MYWIIDYILGRKRCLKCGKRVKKVYDTIKALTSEGDAYFYVCEKCRPESYEFFEEFGELNEE